MAVIAGVFVQPTIELVGNLQPNVWTAYNLPNFTTHFIINSDAIVLVSTESDGSSYLTTRPNEGGLSQRLKGRSSAVTFYLSTPNAGAIARIVSWQN